MKFVMMIFLIVIMMGGNNLFSVPIMYVTAKEGLNKREEPSVNGKKIGQFLFGEMVDVQERGKIATIDGITDYLYKIHEKVSVNGVVVAPWDKYCWVFGGYLSEELPLDAPVIIGRWEYNGEGYWFYATGEYLFLIKGYRSGGGGRWRMNGSTITIEQYDGSILIAIITINDRNNIMLIFSNDEWRLKRINSL
jgi:hypothetical protein